MDDYSRLKTKTGYLVTMEVILTVSIRAMAGQLQR